MKKDDDDLNEKSESDADDSDDENSRNQGDDDENDLPSAGNVGERDDNLHRRSDWFQKRTGGR